MDTVSLEAHKKYIDLQYCIAGGERMSWAHIQELNPTTDDPEHDNYFYTGTSTSVSIRPGHVLRDVPQRRPQGRHRHEFQKHYRKVVVKILIVHQEND